VDAGKPFEQMQDAGMKTALLDRIMRQQDPALLAAVERLSKNETREGIAMLSAQGRVTQIEDKSARIEAIARAYADRPAGSIIVSPDNVSRRDLHERCRGTRPAAQQRGHKKFSDRLQAVA
jgi:hypothetical protein